MTDRRTQRRREDDEAEHEIIEHAVQDAPIVHRLLRTARVASAMLALGTLIGGCGSLLGMRLMGPGDDLRTIASRVETNSQRIDRQAEQSRANTDSLVRIITDVKKAVETMAYIQCVQLRRNDSDLRPLGCDAAEQRGRR